jgi:YD repeat-containing protein
MRRVSALVLVLLFALQPATATASVGPISMPNVQPLLSMIQSTWIFAVLAGQGDLYAKMHAAPPVFPKIGKHGSPPARPVEARTLHSAFAVRRGVEVPLPSMLPRHAFEDKSSRTMPTQVRKIAGVPIRALRMGEIRHAQVTTLPQSTTGINRWWTYAAKPLAGIGDALVNVASGNLIVQSGDVDVPERGIDLAFRRTYNSQSQHDSAGTDGAPTSLFGNGWTNTFDAHVAFNAATNTMSVYDIDGARYDYANASCGSSTSPSCWTPPPGMQGTTLQHGGSGIWWWTKKSGTQYAFFAPDIATPSGWGPAYAAYAGRIWRIYGRNYNNYIVFHYYWLNQDATNINNLSQVVALHSDGHALTLNFGQDPVNPGPIELLSIVLPDNVHQITYSYDASGTLRTVTRPGNSSYANVEEKYWYASGTNTMTWAAGPRCLAASTNGGNTCSDGSQYWFNYDVNSPLGRLTWISDFGLVNFAPSDGMGTPLQSGPTGINFGTPWREEHFVYQANSFTQLTDTQGHATRWYPNTNGNITETDEYTGTGYNWLVTSASWDSSNNVTATTDPRGNNTWYGYDANGNTLWVQYPTVTTSRGSGHPIALYAYDQFNNLIGYCAPNYVWGSGLQACSPTAGTTHYTYDYSDTATEPNGRLTDTYTPMGYHSHITYDSNDYGLPVQVQGDAITQADGTQRQPSRTFAYDTFGNLTGYNKGNGTWTLGYDSLNRRLVHTDPIGVSSYTYYNNDGSVSKTETAYQHANGWGSSFAYDADGNVVTATVLRTVDNATSPSAESTTKWYDGEDRLVEVMLPQDAKNDTYTNSWITRYIYDLTSGANQSFNGAGSFQAYGNLYKTQELLPGGSGPVTQTANMPQSIVNNQFQDLKGNAFDALDRPIAKYSLVNVNNAERVSTETMTYDGTNANGTFVGALTSDCNAASQCTYPGYDALGRTNVVSFSDATSPMRSTTFDPDGRTISITSSVYGTQSYTYDADGRKVTEKEANGGGVTSPAIFTHEYYADGKLKQLDVQSNALNQSGMFAYSYRADGLTQSETINDAAQNIGATVTHAYDASGRVTKRVESGQGGNSNPKTWTYDSYGRSASIDVPTCANCTGLNPHTAINAYDPQGTLLSLTSASVMKTYGYSTRGELISTVPSGQRVPTQPFMANGVPTTAFAGYAATNGYTASTTWDSRSGEMLSKNTSVLGTDTSSTFIYDQVGRLVSETNETANDSNDVSDTLSRTYDVENHTLTSSDGGNLYVATAYAWGPAGHPIRVGSSNNTSVASNQYDTLHWDGDQLVFQTNASGQVDDIKVGAAADITPLDAGFSGITFWDRGPDGSIAFCHNAYGTGVFVAPSGTLGGSCNGGYLQSNGTVYTVPTPNSIIWQSSAFGAGRQTPTYKVGVGQGKLLGMYRTDGMTDGLNTLQGVRTMDASAGTWTTPDAYAGNVHDPRSQKSYMWNNDNPVSFSDPSGFDPCGGDVPSNALQEPSSTMYPITCGSPSSSTFTWQQTASDVFFGIVGGAAVGMGFGSLPGAAAGLMSSLFSQLCADVKPGVYVQNTYNIKTGELASKFVVFIPVKGATGGYLQRTDYNADGTSTTTTWTDDGKTTTTQVNRMDAGGHIVASSSTQTDDQNAPGSVAGSAGAWDDQFASQWNAQHPT